SRRFTPVSDQRPGISPHRTMVKISSPRRRAQRACPRRKASYTPRRFHLPFKQDESMAAATLDVVGIGNAIVDVLAHADDAFLVKHGLNKGAMTLIDSARAEA